ncbi:MBL fold metallo-hydrolase [Thermus sp.]|uniref:MBL fold metallo-hydrolase n=1 Tax=Thermus sp. TaxID=275 RepID=UPI00298EDC81|nr:MBL fold metallo-hydrolase [Thermus sp.]MDW8357779.1 MBL fold metallo-hydrolase [Thermus sp.]
MRLIPIQLGFPARSHRGYLGLSSAYLVLAQKVVLYDTLGFNERENLPSRLTEVGIAPQHVSVVILSHLHFDHAANVDLFPWAEVIVHKHELEHATQVAEEPWRDPACFYSLLTQLKKMSLRVVEKEEEFLPGLRLLHLPGHTPGLLGLEVGGMGALVSDAIKSRFDLVGPPAPPCWNPTAAMQSRERLLGYPRLYPGHDVPLRREGKSFIPDGKAELGILLGEGETWLTL